MIQTERPLHVREKKNDSRFFEAPPNPKSVHVLVLKKQKSNAIARNLATKNTFSFAPLFFPVINLFHLL